MGLLNWERNQKVVWAVHRITELSKEIDTKEYPYDNYEELKKSCEHLWYELWGKSGNGSFWLLGSDDKVQSDGESIWSLALYGKIAHCEKEEKEYEKSILREMLELPEILATISPRDEKVYRIYEWVQQIQYAANRYEDELAEQYAGLMKVCSKIYGQCFTIFNEEERYALAYTLNKVSELLYKNCEPREKAKWDAVTKYLVEDSAHHAIRSPFENLAPAYKLTETKKLWKSLYKDGSLQNRLYCFLELSGENYKHKWDEVMLLVAKHKWDKKKFEALKLKNEKQKADTEKDKTKEWKQEKEYYTKKILGIKNH